MVTKQDTTTRRMQGGKERVARGTRVQKNNDVIVHGVGLLEWVELDLVYVRPRTFG